MRTFIGIDNGVSGSIGIISNDVVVYLHTPIKKELNYTKSKQWLNRINGIELKQILSSYADIIKIALERPMINPGRFKATVSAIRALEASLVVIEDLKLPYCYLDSREWQKEFLPKDLKKEELKAASLQIGKRMFPKIDFKGFTDADGLLIAAYLSKISQSI
jgi:hypothetical protein